jgi:hypothetical protein
MIFFMGVGVWFFPTQAIKNPVNELLNGERFGCRPYKEVRLKLRPFSLNGRKKEFMSALAQFPFVAIPSLFGQPDYPTIPLEPL